MARREVRVYEPHGSGFFFVSGRSAAKWYHRSGADADHFTRTDMDAVEIAIGAGGRVQLAGHRGVSFGVWPGWMEFAEAVGLS